MRIGAYIEELFSAYDRLMPKKPVVMVLSKNRKAGPGSRRWTLHVGTMQNKEINDSRVRNPIKTINYDFTSLNSVDNERGTLPSIFSRLFKNSNISEPVPDSSEALKLAFDYLEEVGVPSYEVTRYMNEIYSKQIVED